MAGAGSIMRAFADRWAAAGLDGEITGGLHFGLGTRDLADPYATYGLAGSPTRVRTSGTGSAYRRIADAMIEVQLYSMEGAYTFSQKADAVRAAFDECDLSPDGVNFYHCRLSTEDAMREGDPPDLKIWSFMFEVRFDQTISK